MKTSLAALTMILMLPGAEAAAGRYACTAGGHTVSFDFGGHTLTLDGQTAEMTQGAATWRASVGGHEVVIAPPEKAGPRIFDISIDRGSTYGGFVVCKGN